MILNVPVSAGEAIDKLTILAIKLARIDDAGKRENVAREHAALLEAWQAAVPDPAPLAPLLAELRTVNEALWEVEDELREHERRADFGPRFVELARQVYHTNDRRAAVKRAINQALGSALVEEKSYAAY